MKPLNEGFKVSFHGHLKITDKNTGEVLLDKSTTNSMSKIVRNIPKSDE